MRHDQFEDTLRSGLATLAREAVPDDVAFVDDLPRADPTTVADGRRVGTRAMAAVIALVVALAGGAVALATHRDRHVPRTETPQPTWTKIPLFPLLARAEHTAVFTGHQVIVWGGRSAPQGNIASAKAPHDSLSDGAAYDVGKNAWSVLPPAPIGARYDAVAAWTGTEMLVVGGKRSGTGPSGRDEFLNDGAAYDPAHHRWRPLPDAPGCPYIGTWTGRTLVVAGACADRASRKLVTAEYDPARNRWTTLPNFSDSVQLVSAGGRVFAWDSGAGGHGAVLDRAAHRWITLPSLPAPGRAYHQSSLPVAYAGHFAVASTLQRPTEDPPRDHAAVDVFDLGTRTWRHYESTAVRSATEGLLITSDEDVLLWGDDLSSTWFTAAPARGEPEWSSTGAGPVRVGSFGSLLPIGPRRFFMWGGQLAGTAQEPTMRPTREGVILQLP